MMMISGWFLNAGVAAVAVATVATTTAATAAAQQDMPAVRPLGAMEHESSMTVRSISEARALPGGRVLVNDIIDHRVLMFDSTLATATVIADSTASTANAYGSSPGGLIPYRGDSTLFVDPASLSMLVLDANGKVARVLAVPRPNEAIFLIGGPFGEPGFDPLGRLVYRGGELIVGRPPAGARAKDFTPQFPDSAPIVRLSLATRAEDTVAFFKLPPTKMSITRTDNGFSASTIINPMPIVDSWALLSDGTVAVVRGHDFHIDWYRPDGTHSSSAKIPFDWQRLTDSLKTVVLDSTKDAMEKLRAARQVALDSTRKLTAGANGTQRVVGDAGAGLGGGGNVVISMRSSSDGGTPPRRGGNAAPPLLTLKFVEPYELPDYRPAFAMGAARSDADGNIWIRTSDAKDGAPIYDIVNGQGTLVDRVELPRFRTIAGFGPGVAYMAVSDSSGGVHLERARIK